MSMVNFLPYGRLQSQASSPNLGCGWDAEFAGLVRKLPR